MTTEPIELLAPARNLACGIAAINHGADAVYIGGPLFGARAAATNSLSDIEQLVAYAHQFHARVYVALNTLLTDEEIEQAVRLSHQLYDLGADALIIQDVGLLEANLPPIPLHSSTQMNNRTVDKVRFLEQVGFAQVVLARELCLAQIREIRAATTIPLEFFIHGALCVCFSGQCYISEVMAGRSANRGQCAQFCRHRFDLKDSTGTIAQRGRYLLSLKDLDLSHHLAALIDAGIRSFKIEGRLKDEHYVKNVTAAYRLALDAIIEGHEPLARASSGRCRFGFTPDPSRSFSRGATDYFLTTPRNPVAEIRTPKSIGQEIGRVQTVSARSFTLITDATIHNGDGLCFFNRHNELIGLRVNRVEGRTVYPKDGVAHLGLSAGMVFYRNLDVDFNKHLDQSTLCRTIAVTMTLIENVEGLTLEIIDEDNIVSSTAMQLHKEQATKAGSTAELALRQLRKSGGTIFTVRDIALDIASDLFVPAAVFNDLRRQAFSTHLEARLRSFAPAYQVHLMNDVPWPATTVDYRDNITNSKAAAFYRRHGVTDIAPQILRAGTDTGCAHMTTKYCIKAQLGLCTRLHEAHSYVEPFILADNTGEYVLEFDCAQCEMTVRKKPMP
jgi:23S rRNA 5-hydroxycytidine C2501 synthase